MPACHRRDATRPPRVTRGAFPPCRPHTPWCDRVEPKRLRPHSAGSTILCLGRPVHHGLPPFDYGPAVLRMPFGFRLAADTLPSGWSRPESSLQSADLGISCTVYSSFPKWCPLGFFLIRRPRPVSFHTHFWISSRGHGTSGTSTHLIHALSGAHYGSVRLPVSVHRRRAP